MMSVTGIPAYDRLAVELPKEFAVFISAVKTNGGIVKPTMKLPRDMMAYFFPRKRRFYYDPERMTVLDRMHEQQHLAICIRRGNWKTRDGQVWRDERAAYSFEHALGMREGFSTEYMDFLARRIEYYQSRISAARAASPFP